MKTTWPIHAEKCEKNASDLFHRWKWLTMSGELLAAGLVYKQYKDQLNRAEYARKQLQRK